MIGLCVAPFLSVVRDIAAWFQSLILICYKEVGY